MAKPGSKANVQQGTPPSSSSASWIAGTVVVIGLVAAFVFLREDAPSEPGSPLGGPAKEQVPAVDVPDPDTSEMLSLAAQTIGTAREAVLRAPNSADAWGGFGEVCDAHKIYDAAAIAYRQAQELAPSDFRWSYLLAVVEDFRGRETDEIVRLFEAASAANDIYPPLFLRYGDALVRQGELDRARAAYERAVELDPNFAMAHRGLGQVMLALDEPQAARRSLETAAGIEAEDGVVFASLAQAYTRLGETELAAEARKKARELPRVLGVPDPIRFAVERRAGTPGMARKRALDAIREARYASALSDARFLVEVEPDDVLYRIWLGTCLVETGDAPAAGEHFARAVELEPEHPQALPLYGGWLEAMGRFDEAVALWERAVTVAEEAADDGARAAHTSKLALAQAKSGKTDLALASFARAAELGLDDAELHHNWGTTWMTKDARKAIERFERSLEIGGDNAGTLYNLGLSLDALGQAEEAREAFERSAALDPHGAAAARLQGG